MTPDSLTTDSLATDSLGTDSLRSAWLSATPAALVALWNIGSAPFLTVMVVDPLKRMVGVERFAVLLGLLLAMVGIAVIVAGFRHLREDRWSRSALIFLGLGLVVSYGMLSERGSPSVAMVEQMHFLSYGSLAALLVVPLRRLGLLLPIGVFSTVLMVALLDEGLQWWVPVRTGEFFDVSLNLFAAVCGQLVGLGLFSTGLFPAGLFPTGLRTRKKLQIGWRPEHAPATGRRPVPGVAPRILGPLVAATVLLIAAFVQVVHLGYTVHDPAVASFQSFFSREALLERNRVAAAAWAVSPPGKLTAFEKENWFRTEAGWHAVARNRANARQDWTTAYYENLILERYYSAFLETPGRNGRSRRLDGEHVSILERMGRLPSSTEGPFESSADNGRIWLRPKPSVLWPLVLVLGGMLLLWARRGTGPRASRGALGRATSSLPPSPR